jgi:hypothetical protein
MASKICLAILLLISVLPAFAIGLVILLYEPSSTEKLLHAKTICFRILPVLRNLEFRLDRSVAVPLLLGGLTYVIAALVCIFRAKTK